MADPSAASRSPSSHEEPEASTFKPSSLCADNSSLELLPANGRPGRFFCGPPERWQLASARHLRHCGTRRRRKSKQASQQNYGGTGTSGTASACSGNVEPDGRTGSAVMLSVWQGRRLPAKSRTYSAPSIFSKPHSTSGSAHGLDEALRMIRHAITNPGRFWELACVVQERTCAEALLDSMHLCNSTAPHYVSHSSSLLTLGCACG